MNYNDWYTNSSGSYSAQDGYSDFGQRQKKKKGVSFMQLIVSMLVISLLSSGLTAYFISSSADKAAAAGVNGGPVVVDDSKVPVATDGPSTNSYPSEELGADTSATTTNSNSNSEVIKSSMSSVVGIYISATTISRTGAEEQSDTSSGSGVIINADGYIVTNNHVVEGGENIRICLQDGTEYSATLIGTDSYTDLAVVKIEANDLPAATLGVSASATVGEPVYAIGNPLGVLTSSVSQGIISGLDRSITVGDHSMTLMQTDAAVNPGNSGGGLFNSKGELIGIVNAKSYGLNVEGIGFAIPLDSAKPIIADLIKLGYVSGRPYIGINMQDVSLRGSSDNSGNENGRGGSGSDVYDFFSFYGGSYLTRVQVTAVQEGSPADIAGIKVNDILVSLGDTEITGTSQLSALLYEYKVGDTVTITVLRGTENVEMPLTLGERKS